MQKSPITQASHGLKPVREVSLILSVPVPVAAGDRTSSLTDPCTITGVAHLDARREALEAKRPLAPLIWQAATLNSTANAPSPRRAPYGAAEASEGVSPELVTGGKPGWG